MDNTPKPPEKQFGNREVENKPKPESDVEKANRILREYGPSNKSNELPSFMDEDGIKALNERFVRELPEDTKEELAKRLGKDVADLTFQDCTKLLYEGLRLAEREKSEGEAIAEGVKKGSGEKKDEIVEERLEEFLKEFLEEKPEQVSYHMLGIPMELSEAELNEYSSLTKIEMALTFIENCKGSNDSRYLSALSEHLLTFLSALTRLVIKLDTREGRVMSPEIDGKQVYWAVDTLGKLVEDPSRTDIDRKEFADEMRKLLYMTKITDSS